MYRFGNVNKEKGSSPVTALNIYFFLSFTSFTFRKSSLSKIQTEYNMHVKSM